MNDRKGKRIEVGQVAMFLTEVSSVNPECQYQLGAIGEVVDLSTLIYPVTLQLSDGFGARYIYADLHEVEVLE